MGDTIDFVGRRPKMTDSDTTRTPSVPPSGPSSTAAGTEAGVPPPQPEASAPPPSTAPPAAPPTAPPAVPPPAPSSWRPPASDSGRNASLILGVIILVIGAWFFATRTLGLDLPDFDWGQLWPVVLILLGAWIVLSAVRQRSG
jgi:hypothetical protein